jgi:D-alanyl-D-alanine carboxypeptidase
VATVDKPLDELLATLSLRLADFADRTVYHEAATLVLLGKDCFERDAHLTPETALAWKKMRGAATTDGLELLLVSAFRSYTKQAELFKRKLDQGWNPKDIMNLVAAPGFSEHHTGRAVDVGAPGNTNLSESFEDTDEFRWLQINAAAFGFSMSYPRNNPKGVRFEPWHWLFTGPSTS